MTGTLPASTLDLFSEEFLCDPYPAHEELREAAPAVLLERYGVWAMARHEHVHDALSDWETYRSGAGVGLADLTKGTPWRPPSLLLEADPPAHDRARQAIAGALSPKRVRDLQGALEHEAEALVERRVSRERFDAMEDLAEAYPSKVFPDAVGLPDGSRENLMAYAPASCPRRRGSPKALARRVSAIELDGESERLLNNTLRGLTRPPVRVRGWFSRPRRCGRGRARRASSPRSGSPPWCSQGATTAARDRSPRPRRRRC